MEQRRLEPVLRYRNRKIARRHKDGGKAVLERLNRFLAYRSSRRVLPQLGGTMENPFWPHGNYEHMEQCSNIGCQGEARRYRLRSISEYASVIDQRGSAVQSSRSSDHTSAWLSSKPQSTDGDRREYKDPEADFIAYQSSPLIGNPGKIQAQPEWVPGARAPGGSVYPVPVYPSAYVTVPVQELLQLSEYVLHCRERHNLCFWRATSPYCSHHWGAKAERVARNFVKFLVPGKQEGVSGPASENLSASGDSFLKGASSIVRDGAEESAVRNYSDRVHNGFSSNERHIHTRSCTYGFCKQSHGPA